MRETRPLADADRLVIAALDELGQTYGDQVFYVERDVVWMVQRRLNALIESSRLPWRVYNDFPMIPGARRSLSADLAVTDGSGRALVAVEFKYEPCHRRIDVLTSKLPVTAWAAIVKDTDRVRDFVDRGIAPIAYAVVIDEGGYLAHRDLAVYANRQRWSGAPHHQHQVDALISATPPPKARAIRRCRRGGIRPCVGSVGHSCSDQASQRVGSPRWRAAIR